MNTIIIATILFSIGVVVLSKHLLIKKHSRDKIFVVTTALINLFLLLPLVVILVIALLTTETPFSELVTIFVLVQGIPLVLFLVSFIHYTVSKRKKG